MILTAARLKATLRRKELPGARIVYNLRTGLFTVMFSWTLVVECSHHILERRASRANPAAYVSTDLPAGLSGEKTSRTQERKSGANQLSAHCHVELYAYFISLGI